MENLSPTEVASIKGHWACSLCKGSVVYFNDEEDFQFHLRTHCHLCDQAYSSSEVWDIHHESVHFGQHGKLLTDLKRAGSKQTFYCGDCGKMFMTDLAFKMHRDKYKFYKCLGCSKDLKDFKSWCGHSNLCEESWEKMAKIDIVRECFGCGQKFLSMLDCLKHYEECKIVIARDAVLTELPRDKVLDGIRTGIAVLEGTKNKKSNSLNIKVPIDFLRSLKQTMAASNNNSPKNKDIENEAFYGKKITVPATLNSGIIVNPPKDARSAHSRNEDSVLELEVAHQRDHNYILKSPKAPTKETLKITNVSSLKKRLENNNGDLGGGGSAKKLKIIYPKQKTVPTTSKNLPVIEARAHENIPIQDDAEKQVVAPDDNASNHALFQKNPSNKTPGLRGPNDGFTIDDFNEKFLESMLDQRPNVFKKFLVKNRAQILPLMGLTENHGTTDNAESNVMVQSDVGQEAGTSCFLPPMPMVQIPRSLADEISVKEEPIETPGQQPDGNPNNLTAIKKLHLELPRLQLSKDHVKVTPVSIPNDWMPLGMTDFAVLDSQEKIDTPASCKILIRPNLMKPRSNDEELKTYGWQNGVWLNDRITDGDSVPITVENGDDGETVTSWCKMTY